MTLRHRWRPGHLSWRDNVSLWLSDFGSDLRVARTLSVAHLGRHQLRFLAHLIVRTSLERAWKVGNMLATMLGTCLEHASNRYGCWEHAQARNMTSVEEAWNMIGTGFDHAWHMLELGERLDQAWDRLETIAQHKSNHAIVTTRSRTVTNNNKEYYCVIALSPVSSGRQACRVPSVFQACLKLVPTQSTLSPTRSKLIPTRSKPVACWIVLYHMMWLSYYVNILLYYDSRLL